MNHNTIEVAADDYDRFVHAARAAAAPELDNLVRTVITALREMDAVGLFGGLAARHLWDEYCWQLQEGPYDDDDVGFGSTSSNFREILSTTINGALDALPKHTLLFLSIYARNDIDDADDPDGIGSISRGDIATAVLEGVEKIASRRNLDFIGPYRGDVIPMEISLDGLAGDALSEADGQSDFLSEHIEDLLVGGEEEITHISHALLERYMELLHEDEDGRMLSTLLERFEKQIKALVLEKDIRPAVEDAVAQLEAALDKES